MRMRAPWNVNATLAVLSYACKSAGTSVSIVTFELGTMRPTRQSLTADTTRLEVESRGFDGSNRSLRSIGPGIHRRVRIECECRKVAPSQAAEPAKHAQEEGQHSRTMQPRWPG